MNRRSRPLARATILAVAATLCGFVATAARAGDAAEPAATTTSDAAAEIGALLASQSAAWNRGDIDGFMQGYAPVDTLRFASGDSVTYGWKSTRERYHRRYPDRATMGALSFSELAVTELAPDAAIAFGRWSLARAGDTPHGLFTLTLRKTPAGWRIIQDHTSAAAP